MKKVLLFLCSVLLSAAAFSQTVYYWVGGTAPSTITTGSNWNTQLDGSGTARPSTPGTTDILIFNGANVGGATPATGTVTVPINGGVTCSQMKFINNAVVVFTRTSSGTGTITLGNDTGDDFVIEAGSSLALNSTGTNLVIAFGTGTTGLVSGAFSMSSSVATQRISNGTTGTAGSLVFASGSSFTSNNTISSTSAPFGTNSQSSDKWVVFMSGAQLYYNGGWSPMGSTQAFSAIDFRPGSVWHHRATNATSGFGSFFNTKNFADIIVENGATLAADGPIYHIDNLTVNGGCTFITHSSGTTNVFGNIVVDGTYTSQATQRGNVLILAGTTPQTVSGAGAITIPSLIVADNANVTLNRNITNLDSNTNIYGKLNFGTSQLTGAGTFTSRVNTQVTGLTGTLTNGSSQVTAVAGTLLNLNGLTVTGPGIPANTTVVNFSVSSSTINLSKAATATASGVALTLVSDTAILETANPNGFDSTSGSVTLVSTKNYQSGTSYVIDAATSKPFGVSSGFTGTHVNTGLVTVNANITTNIGAYVTGLFTLNSGKVTIRSMDTVRILTGSALAGSYNAANYFVTTADATTGAQGVLRVDGMTAGTLLPIGTSAYYMPATVTPAGTTDIAASVFQGITSEGTPNGTPLTPLQKQTKVDAVWNLNPLNGSGGGGLQLQWAQALEGSTFTTLPSSDIGIITNLNPSWSLPVAPGDNANNTASGTVSSFGTFGIGAQPPAQPFVFNTLPAKTYGDPDFNAGVISLNTTAPITYTSSNTSVATIVGSNIHIVGTGTTDITATQASDGFYPAANVTQTLTVNKAPLTIKADDQAKPQGDPNPALTVTYSGFVNGETSSVLTTAPTVTTTAVTASPAGTYPIVPSGAAATNYAITYVNGTLTVTPRQNQTITFNALPAKTYGAADFAAGATSTNTTIPITYTSSNPAVATIVGNNIHIVGAGTATITASQAGSPLYFAAPNVSQTLTVNKATLTVRAVDTSRLYGADNPAFRLTYSGFVLGQNASVLTTQPTATTPATATSAPGYYTINVDGGAAQNYSFVYTAGRLTVLPATGAGQAYMQVYMSGSNTMTVKVFSPNPDLGDIYLYDIGGRLLLKKNVFIAQGFLSYDIPVNVPASGLYIVRVVSKNLRLRANVAIIR